MPMATARRLCPQGVFLPVRMQHYAQIGRQIRDIFLSLHAAGRAAEPGRSVPGRARLRGAVRPGARRSRRRIKDRIRAETGPDGVGRAWPPTSSWPSWPATTASRTACGRAARPGGRRSWRRCRSAGSGAWAPRARSGCTRWASAPSASWPRCPSGSWPTTSARSADTSGNWPTATTTGPSSPTGRPSRSAPRRRSPEDIGDRQVLRAWLLDLVDQLAGRLRKEGVRAGRSS